MHQAISQLLKHLSELTGLLPHQIDRNTSLLAQGVDSIGLMRTVNLLRKQGVDCSFESLSAQPTLNNWLHVIDTEITRAQDNTLPLCTLQPLQPVVLTPVQQAYWVGRQDDQPLGGNSCQVYLELQGDDVSPQQLELACQQLVERHAMLRARFTQQGEQYIAEDLAPFPVNIIDLREQFDVQVEEYLDRYRQQFSHYRADVINGWPLKVTLFRLPNKHSRLHINIDLLVADVLSVSILLNDLARLYRQDTLAPLPVNFLQYLLHQQRLSNADWLHGKNYWQSRLTTLPSAPALPLAQQPGRLCAPKFTRRDYLLKRDQLSILENKAKQYGVTFAVVLLTLYCEVLARWSETKHFLVNIPLFNRKELLPGVVDMVADFTSLLLLEADFRQPRPFIQRLQQIQQQLHRDIEHAEYSGIDVLRDLARQNTTMPPAAPVVFALNLGQPFISLATEQVFGKLHWMISQTPQVWIDHQSYPTREGLLLNWDSVDALFPEGLVETMFYAWLSRLHHLITQPWENLSEFIIPANMRAIRTRTTSYLAVSRQRLESSFFKLARRQPEMTAIIMADRHISYGSLAQRALAIASTLQQIGVMPQDIVAINLPKGVEQIASVLGVLVTGACWLPLAVAHPLSRRSAICNQAKVRCVIVSEEENWPDTIPVLNLNKQPQGIAVKMPTKPYSGSDEELAYIIYTSGSTGEPKGVAVTHKSAWNTIDTLNRRFAIGAEDRVLALSGLEFDLSVYDIFGLLSVGGALIIPSEDQRRDPDSWLTLAASNRASLWNSVPALLEMLLLSIVEEGQTILPNLRMVWVSGDLVAPDLAKRLRQRLTQPVRVIAMGGATEASIWSNAFEILPSFETDMPVPYGFPLPNQCFSIMDEHCLDVPDWVPGELWIGGAGLAQGYIHDEEKTAKHFIYYEGERWYRTGDRGFYQPDGLMQFLGRQDNQVKVDGNRIELAEIEVALQRLPGVLTAYCLLIDAHLEAVITSSEKINTTQLRNSLTEVLPAYMLPKRIHHRNVLPLTVNGKVDRRKLVEEIATTPWDPISVDTTVAAVSPLQAKLHQIWLEILDSTSIDPSTSFFLLGGNSLQAMRLINRINQTFTLSLTLRQFLNNSTLASLTTFIITTYPTLITGEEGTI